MRIANSPILGDRFALSALAATLVAGARRSSVLAPKTKRLVSEVIDELYKVNWPRGRDEDVTPWSSSSRRSSPPPILGVFDITFGYLAANNLFLY